MRVILHDGNTVKCSEIEFREMRAYVDNLVGGIPVDEISKVIEADFDDDECGERK